MAYSLSKDGDAIERAAADSFLPSLFPSYEVFWREFVCPLTKRPKSIHFKDDTDFTDQPSLVHARLCIAQLHYSVLRNVWEVWPLAIHEISFADYLRQIGVMTHGMTLLCGALDIAEELIARFTELPNVNFDPWNEAAGKKARFAFRKRNPEPTSIGQLRHYRNHLVHGRLTPSHRWGPILRVPKPGTEVKYLDWRTVTNARDLGDMVPVQVLVEYAARTVIQQLEKMWQAHLLPRI